MPIVLHESPAPLTALPFDLEAAVQGISEWAACESPTWDAGAVDRMLDLASRDLAVAGARIERLPGRMGLGGCVRARFGTAEDTPGILVLAHLDTVHPLGTRDRLPIRVEGDKLFGPGVCDMKGGTWLAVEALRVIHAAGLRTALPVTVLLTPDEEIGTPSTRDIIEAEARRHRIILVPEPGTPGDTPFGNLASGRYPVSRFTIRTTGRPSHAGAHLSAGRSAIREMCHQVLRIEDLSSESCTYSVGVIQGGEWANCVATTCDARILMSGARTEEERQAGIARLLALQPSSPDVALTITPTVMRPLWTPGEGCRQLVAHAQAICDTLGLATAAESGFGGSDGNFTGVMGIPTLDGLGVLGGGIHTLDEHLLIGSLLPRARLLAGLLLQLAVQPDAAQS